MPRRAGGRAGESKGERATMKTKGAVSHADLLRWAIGARVGKFIGPLLTFMKSTILFSASSRSTAALLVVQRGRRGEEDESQKRKSTRGTLRFLARTPAPLPWSLT